MQLIALNLQPHIDQMLLHFLRRHPQPPRHNRHTHSLQARQQIHPHPRPQRLHLLPHRPRADRELRPLLYYIHEPNLFKDLLIPASTGEVFSQCSAASHEALAPELEGSAVATVVNEAEREIAVLQLEIAA